MDIRTLKYFLAVVREGSITRAAEILHTTQPNISRQLIALEEQAGVKLFKRGSRKIVLAEEGVFLYKRAQEIVELLERTEIDLALYNEVTSGDVYIGATEAPAMRLIAQAIRVLRENHPQVMHHFFSGNTQEVVEQLDKGLLNFAVLVDPSDLQKYDHIRFPVTDTVGILMRQDSPLAKLESIRPQDIKDKPLLCSRRLLKAGDLSRWFGEDMNKLDLALTFNLITTPAMMVEEGVGYAFTYDKLANSTEGSNLCFRPLEPKVETRLYLVWKKDQVLSKAAKAFLAQVQRTTANENNNAGEG